MSPRHYLTNQAEESFPRVSGDEPRVVERHDQRPLFSPRERG